MPAADFPCFHSGVMPRTKAKRASVKAYRVRAGRLEDAKEIARLSGDLGYPATVRAVRERLRGLLSRADQRVLVAEETGGPVCGWLQAHSSIALETGPRVEIVGLIVSQAMRRRGVGRRLVARAEAWATEISVATVVVRSNIRRTESRTFYPSLGYRPSKTQVVYRKRLPN